MPGSLFSRFILGVVCVFITVSVSVAGATIDSGRAVNVGSSTVGLALDKRGNLYTADSRNGHVYCVPPGSQPVLLAKVEGRPTALAVDRLRNVFVGTDQGVVFLVSLDGTVQEVYRCCASPVGLEIDRDGGLVLVMETGDVVKVDRTQFLKRP